MQLGTSHTSGYGLFGVRPLFSRNVEYERFDGGADEVRRRFADGPAGWKTRRGPSIAVVETVSFESEWHAPDVDPAAWQPPSTVGQFPGDGEQLVVVAYSDVDFQGPAEVVIPMWNIGTVSFPPGQQDKARAFMDRVAESGTALTGEMRLRSRLHPVSGVGLYRVQLETLVRGGDPGRLRHIARQRFGATRALPELEIGPPVSREGIAERRMNAWELGVAALLEVAARVARNPTSKAWPVFLSTTRQASMRGDALREAVERVVAGADPFDVATGADQIVAYDARSDAFKAVLREGMHDLDPDALERTSMLLREAGFSELASAVASGPDHGVVNSTVTR